MDIRLAQPTDAPAMLAIYAPYCEASCVSFEIVAPSLEQMQQRVAHISATYPWLVAEHDGRLVGYVYANRHRERAAYRWAVDTAVYVAPDQQRRGVGRALYAALFSLLRELGYFKAFAGITLPNPASVGLHESIGFRRVAVFERVGFKRGKWLDVGWWQNDLQPEVDHPPDPRSIVTVRDTPALRAALATAREHHA